MTMSREWEVLERKTVFRAGPIQEIAVETVRLPDGHIIDDYYAIQLPDYVLIFPEMEDGSIRMLRQYRHGLRRVCLGFPGGAIEPGETPLDAARRELREELGMIAGAWHSVGALRTNGNQGCNTAHLFRATACRVVEAPGAPDMEQPEIVAVRAEDLFARPALLEEIGLASHVALLLAATHPGVAGGR
jgi:ADP-ribose pyrophosphatase